MKPDETAFKYLGEVTTWRPTADRMDAFAAALSRRGVGFGDRVLLLTLNRPEVVLSVFGINRLGAIAVPINIRLTPPEIAYIADDADADVLTVEAPLAPLVCAIAHITDRIKKVIVIGEPVADGQESWADLAAEDSDGFVAPDIPRTPRPSSCTPPARPVARRARCSTTSTCSPSR